MIHLETMFKVDVFILKQRPYDRVQFGRLDLPYLRQWAGAIGLSGLLDRALKEAAAQRAVTGGKDDAFKAVLSQVLDWNWRDGIRGREAEDARVEIQLGFDGALDVRGFAETVAFGGKGDIGVRQAFGAQSGDHDLRLGRWNDLVFESLKQDHGA